MRVMHGKSYERYLMMTSSDLCVQALQACGDGGGFSLTTVNFQQGDCLRSMPSALFALFLLLSSSSKQALPVVPSRSA